MPMQQHKLRCGIGKGGGACPGTYGPPAEHVNQYGTMDSLVVFELAIVLNNVWNSL